MVVSGSGMRRFRSTGSAGCWTSGNLCKLITIVAAIATTVLATAGLPTPELLCSYNDGFLYTVPGSQCSAYYRCYDNQPIRYECPDGAKFDFNQQRCVRTKGTCYEPVCTGKTNGVYGDTSQNCQRSYRCKGGSIEHVDICPIGRAFDGRRCSPVEEITCENPSLSSASFNYEADSRCYGLTNGNHVLQDSGNCRKYLVCHANQVQDVLECPPGYGFDERAKRCTLLNGGGCHSPGNQPASTEVVNSCSFLPDGLHLAATSKDCRTYVQCQSRRQINRLECPPMTVYNGQQCVPSFLYHCPRLDLPGDVCQHRQNGYYVDPRKGCGYYVRCAAERTVEQYSCPYGFYFDESSGACRGNEENDGTCHRLAYSVDCAQRASGYYQDFTVTANSPVACGTYFHCHNGAKTVLRCRNGFIFDGENCVSEASYTCSIEDIDSCRRKPNGYYKDARSGCRAYHLCTDGNKISYLCGPGQVFANGACVERRRSERSSDETLTCDEDSICAGRPDGYYPDRASLCRQYYFCQRNEKLQTLTCRGSKVFDGHSCVSRDAYNCPAPDDVDAAASENCISRDCSAPICERNGFFADYDSNCEQYFFCIDGKQSALRCSSNYVFNGEICVPSGSYYCPRYCTPAESC
ncbi:uncharacterized protein LOC125959362 [Anopheles darlingi]|uniref:uncharacterized protein LOC125959362 n=1 Tax=Anopheles darlingi TaxID=43151 RepID=UPI0020FFF9DD|nr:uncharacterized protein LOC125959362 [Anopheles darlingi]